MVIYTDKIIVSFSDADKTECNYCCLGIRYCPLCKSYKEFESFRSFQKNKKYNNVCRRCLDKQNSYRNKNILKP